MNPDAISEVLALVVQGNPAEAITFGAVVTIFCDNPVSAARWTERTPGNHLPETRTPVQVVTVGGAASHAAHDCEACADCIHDGYKCCGCYDGACCRTPPWSETSEGGRR